MAFGIGIERQGEALPLKDRIGQYLPPLEMFYEYPGPGPVERELKERLKAQLPGAKYVLTFNPVLKKLIICPFWHPLNMDPKETPGRDYAQVVFEGGSVEPVLSEKGEIIAGNIILHGPRQERFKKSIRAHGFDKKIDFAALDRGIKDLVSISGKDPLVSPEGIVSRGYLRPTVARAAGRYGVRPGPDQEIDQTAAYFNWVRYLEAEAYVKGEKVAIFTDQQRLTPIMAKEARNYGNGSELSARAKQFGVGEILFFGPYTVDEETRTIGEYVNVAEGKTAAEKLIKHGVLADGMGEEILAVAGGILLYPPLDTDRLGGTTLQYVIEHMLPAMGLQSKECRFSLEDIRNGYIDALLFLGNAVKVCPIAEIRVCGPNGVIEKIKLNPKNLISQQIVKRYPQELSGEIPPSHPSLLTRIEFSPEARAKLDEAYSAWI